MYTSQSYKSTQISTNPITIRAAGERDGAALSALAQRDTADVPTGLLLLAEAGGELRAAISVESGEWVSDPFHPTAEIVALLRGRAAQLRGDRRRGLGSRLRRALGSRRLSPQPAGTLRAFE